MAERIGMTYGKYLEYEAMTQSPFCSQQQHSEVGSGNWKWRPSALKIAAFWGVDPGELWPDAVLAIKQPTVVAIVDADRLGAFQAFEAMRSRPMLPSEAFESAELRETIDRAMECLTPIERKVLHGYFGLDGGEERTCADIAGDYGLSRGRIDQLRQQALRKMENHMKVRERLRD